MSELPIERRHRKHIPPARLYSQVDRGRECGQHFSKRLDPLVQRLVAGPAFAQRKNRTFDSVELAIRLAFAAKRSMRASEGSQCSGGIGEQLSASQPIAQPGVGLEFRLWKAGQPLS